MIRLDADHLRAVLDGWQHPEIANCFESDDLETSTLLLDALHHRSIEHAAAESYVTLRQPPARQLELALERGYTIGRYKLRKSIAPRTP